MIQYKRSQILVDPKVQWAIGRRIILHWFLFGFSMVSVNIMLRTLLSITDEPFMSALWSAAVSQITVVFVMAVMLPMFVFDTMKLSNRFAGPMYRLRSGLVKLRSSEPMKPLKFRSGDFWAEVAEDFNRVAKQQDALRRRVAELEEELKARHEGRPSQATANAAHELELV